MDSTVWDAVLSSIFLAKTLIIGEVVTKQGRYQSSAQNVAILLSVLSQVCAL